MRAHAHAHTHARTCPHLPVPTHPPARGYAAVLLAGAVPAGWVYSANSGDDEVTQSVHSKSTEQHTCYKKRAATPAPLPWRTLTRTGCSCADNLDGIKVLGEESGVGAATLCQHRCKDVAGCVSAEWNAAGGQCLYFAEGCYRPTRCSAPDSNWQAYTREVRCYDEGTLAECEKDARLRAWGVRELATPNANAMTRDAFRAGCNAFAKKRVAGRTGEAGAPAVFTSASRDYTQCAQADCEQYCVDAYECYALVLDVREAAQYDQGHAPCSVNMPEARWDNPNQVDLRALEKDLAASKATKHGTIAVYSHFGFSAEKVLTDTWRSARGALLLLVAKALWSLLPLASPLTCLPTLPPPHPTLLPSCRRRRCRLQVIVQLNALGYPNAVNLGGWTKDNAAIMAACKSKACTPMHISTFPCVAISSSKQCSPPSEPIPSTGETYVCPTGYTCKGYTAHVAWGKCVDEFSRCTVGSGSDGCRPSHLLASRCKIGCQAYAHLKLKTSPVFDDFKETPPRTAAKTTPAAPAGYDRRLGCCADATNGPGNVAESTPGLGLQACADLCNATKSCVAFSHNAEHGPDGAGSLCETHLWDVPNTLMCKRSSSLAFECQQTDYVGDFCFRKRSELAALELAAEAHPAQCGRSETYTCTVEGSGWSNGADLPRSTAGHGLVHAPKGLCKRVTLAAAFPFNRVGQTDLFVCMDGSIRFGNDPGYVAPLPATAKTPCHCDAVCACVGAF